MKECINCGESKGISDFYKHGGMTDGHLSSCKDCVKKRVKKRSQKLMLDPSEVEKERKRSREKYYRLGYKDKHKPSKEVKREAMKRYANKYPEKMLSTRRSSHVFKAGYEKHHWSYREQDAKNVVFIKREDHAMLHRYTSYDQERMMYRGINGVLIDSRKRVELIFDEIGIVDFEWKD